MSKTPITNDSTGLVTILLDGDTGDVIVGGNGENGRISIYPQSANGTIPETSTIDIQGANGQVRIGGGYYHATAGGLSGPPIIGVNGSLEVQNQFGDNMVSISGKDGDVLLGGGDNASAFIHLDTGSATVRVGGGKMPPSGSGSGITQTAPGPAGLIDQGTSGVISLRDAADNEVVRLTADKTDIVAGGNGHNGHLALFDDQAGDTKDVEAARIHLRAENANIVAGGHGADGTLALFAKTDANGKAVNDTSDPSKAAIFLDAEKGNITLTTLTGDVLLSGGADCAEEFGISGAEAVEPGTVMVIGQEGTLLPSNQAYDRKVAGVIAGAGSYKSGIVLDRRVSVENRQPVALVGKVYCKVDARRSSVEIGDLLTTSPTSGHAMKADNPLLAFGAVIGKALMPLHGECGLIPILVTLQ